MRSPHHIIPSLLKRRPRRFCFCSVLWVVAAVVDLCAEETEGADEEEEEEVVDVGGFAG